jgi:asparagine synthase (glutamine-hydrolysing)
MGEPNSNPSGLSMMYLYKSIAKDGHRLVLTGEGADEIFGGYERYTKLKKFTNIFSKLPDLSFANLEGSTIGKYLFSDKFRNEKIWYHLHQDRSDKNLKRLYQIEEVATSLPKNSLAEVFLKKRNLVAATLFNDLSTWLSMESNRKLDRISMWNSIEARSPFQSEKVVGVGYREMSKFDFDKLNKAVLLESFPSLKILELNSKKIGFISPLGHWLRNNSEFVIESIMYLSTKLNLDRKELNSLMSSPKRRDFSELKSLWNLTVLSSWYRKCNP